MTDSGMAAPDRKRGVTRSPLLDAKVMMVDDEPLMTELIQTHLEDEGYANFVVTNDPREALPMLRREEPGVLLLDLMMPHISGFELLQTIRADATLSYLPVIVLTAATGADAKLRALQLGATDFLSKPVDASELVLRVRNTLAFHQYHRRQVNFDAVTGLPNQRLFERGISDAITRNKASGSVLALFSIHVPECRQLRDTVDQATADDLAREIARRLEHFLNTWRSRMPLSRDREQSSAISRLGGAYFGLVLEGLADAEAVEAMAKDLHTVLCEPVTLGVHDLAPTAWLGIALSPADGETPSALRQGADLAATHARERGSIAWIFASPELNARSLRRLTLASQLRGAAARGELLLHYQPKVEVVSGRIIGAEALVRWQHPEHGLVPPGQFIPLAEESGLILGIGQWVIEQACHDAAQWARSGLGQMKIAVNVAKAQFMGGTLGTSLHRALDQSGLQPGCLVVELTESTLMDDVPMALALMLEIKALGVTLSIDDFGTGYSSLSYLKRFPLDELKIDQSFVQDLPGGRADAAIVRTIIDLGHNLGMSVIAEGVETTAQLECLRQIGCDNYQGYLFQRPLPMPAFVALLQQHHRPA